MSVGGVRAERRSLAPPTGRPTAAILFLDAELYLERVGAAAVARRLRNGMDPTRGSLPLPRRTGRRRHEDFVCRPAAAGADAGRRLRLCLGGAAAKGYSVSYREYDGDHDPDCWREDLSLALP